MSIVRYTNKKTGYEYDIEIIVKKIKHVFYHYDCLDCGTIFSSKYPIHLRRDWQEAWHETW